MTEAGITYQQLHAELEALWERGEGESPAADALRDRMDAPWYAMTEDDRQEFYRNARKTP